MGRESTLKTGWVIGWAIFYFAALPTISDAQTGTDAVDLDIQLAPSIANAQVINISDLLNPEGSDNNIYNVTIQNLSSEPIDDLYLGTVVESAEDGVLIQTYQIQGQPFDLAAGERITSFNSNLPIRLADEGGFIPFGGGLTSTGQQFSNDLGSLSALPPGRYTLQINLYHGSNSPNGGQLLASAEVTIGSNIAENVRDIFLTTPGDALGAGAQIMNPYPVYRWDGQPGTTYRLIVVEATDNQSPESLLQSAYSTAPFLSDQLTATNTSDGTILDYEIIDARIQNTTFQTPSVGVQPLEEGKTYYWQIFTELRTNKGQANRASEIWSFRLAGDQEALSLDEDRELALVLHKLLGDQQYQDLQQKQSTLISIQTEGKTYTGAAALKKLIQLKEQLDEEKISFLIK